MSYICETKVCTGCKREVSLADFHVKSTKHQSLHARCCECRRKERSK